MVHLRRPLVQTPMFTMALAATAYIGVKGCRLALQDCGVVRVTDNTVGGLYAFDRSMTGGAVVFQKPVCYG